MGRLTALSVKNAKPGRHGDGEGLYLLVKPSGAKSWLLRIQADGKRRDIGLGSVVTAPKSERVVSEEIEVSLLRKRDLTLIEAREKAGLLRRAAKAGLDPVLERDKERRVTPTFKEATKAAHLALKSGWADKNAAAFLSSLEEHAWPKLGAMKVDVVEAHHIRDAIEPIWLKLPVMARKVRQRISTVLNFAKSKGWRASEAPGKAVTIGLPKQPTGGNFKAMPYSDVPAFVSALEDKPVTAGRSALLFQILTAARPGEVRAAAWGQIDFDKGEWCRPADIMKSGVSHTVTLNAAAMALLKRVGGDAEHKPHQLIFSGKAGGKLSDMTLNKVLRDAKMAFDAHGFRSSFRDWAAEKMPSVPDPVAEAALAHAVPDKVVRAYKRTTFLEMRRALLTAWGNFCLSQPQSA
ncbi:integrase [Sphingomonas sp. BE138]|uniref:tyrosine-type recombinase/integrase n=1 Tax=Sphingomonas sp. BE138 TaxID=2817845 RepID=UPI0028636879|nr:integrase arm-type DNA-binding domain-containing protein [Sphingomonas sp. BE138]MDR6788724.1 integrase [Sphingomonas sp. BE138]